MIKAKSVFSLSETAVLYLALASWVVLLLGLRFGMGCLDCVPSPFERWFAFGFIIVFAALQLVTASEALKVVWRREWRWRSWGAVFLTVGFWLVVFGVYLWAGI